MKNFTLPLGWNYSKDLGNSISIKKKKFPMKTMTNLDSILKSTDITLPLKVFIVKAMIFPVVMYGCENWTIKKAEHWKADAFYGVEDDSWESLGEQGDQTSQS